MFYLFKKIVLIMNLSLALLVPLQTPALSQAVKNISVGVARGDTDGGATITVWLGHGLNLDFSPTGEIIRKVWLDDPSKMIVDFDGNIAGGGAKIIHLRRINPVNIPQLPTTASTLLTVVTEGVGGSTNLYSFKVTYGNGAPEYTTVRISGVTPVASNPASPLPASNPETTSLIPVLTKGNKTVVSFNDSNLNAQDIYKGLSRQCWNGLIPLSAWEYGKAKNFLALIYRGLPAADALKQSGISLEALERLSEIGTQCEL